MPSAAIRSYSYDAQSRELKVGFRPGGDYVYRGVPPEEFEALKAAQSKGTYVNQVIKARYPYDRLDAPRRRIILAD